MIKNNNNMILKNESNYIMIGYSSGYKFPIFINKYKSFELQIKQYILYDLTIIIEQLKNLNINIIDFCILFDNGYLDSNSALTFISEKNQDYKFTIKPNMLSPEIQKYKASRLLPKYLEFKNKLSKLKITPIVNNIYEKYIGLNLE
jgi:acyl carrier protein